MDLTDGQWAVLEPLPLASGGPFPSQQRDE
jgi:hypothetical protein